MFVKYDKEYKLGLLDKSPVPESYECFILYQKEQIRKHVIIKPFEQVHVAAVRHGRYNRIMAIDLKSKEISYQKNISMQESEFEASIYVKVECKVKDVEIYFLEEKENEEKIKRDIRKIILSFENKFSIHMCSNFHNYLEKELEEELSKNKGISVCVKEIRVTLDECAKKILDSERNKVAEINVYKNKTDERIEKKKQDERITYKELELLDMFMDKYGEAGLYYKELSEGKISAPEYEALRNQSIKSKLELCKYIADNDLAPMEMIYKQVRENVISNSRTNLTLEEDVIQDKEKIGADNGWILEDSSLSDDEL